MYIVENPTGKSKILNRDEENIWKIIMFRFFHEDLNYMLSYRNKRKCIFTWENNSDPIFKVDCVRVLFLIFDVCISLKIEIFMIEIWA